MSRTPAGVAVSKVRARLHNLVVSAPDQPHIRSPFATAAPTSRLRRAGLRKTRTFLENGVSSHGLLRFVHLDPSGLITSRDHDPGGHIFQSATSSFRASATIVVLRRRLPLRSIRSSNQRVSADRG